MIAFAETSPTIEPLHGCFVLTFASGEDKVQVMLTRHALFKLGRDAARAGQQAFENKAKITPLRKTT